MTTTYQHHFAAALARLKHETITVEIMVLSKDEHRTLFAKIADSALAINKSQIAFSYRAVVQTKKDEWIEIKLPLDKFEATSFGRVVKDAGAVEPNEINAVGFMLGDKKAGAFKLEVEWIKVLRAK